MASAGISRSSRSSRTWLGSEGRSRSSVTREASSTTIRYRFSRRSLTSWARTISEVSTSTTRTSMRTSSKRSTKLPRTTYLAPTIRPIWAAVLASTRPLVPRSCSSIRSRMRPRSTTRSSVFTESSVTIIC